MSNEHTHHFKRTGEDDTPWVCKDCGAVTAFMVESGLYLPRPCAQCGESPCQCCEVCKGPCRGH